MLIHAPEPVRQPAGACLEKNHLQLRVAFESTTADQAQAGKHLLDRMRDRVREKPFSGEPIGAGGRKKRAGAFVNQERYAELDNGFVKRVVISVVDVAPFDGIGSDEDSFEAELVDDSLGFGDGEL